MSLLVKDVTVLLRLVTVGGKTLTLRGIVFFAAAVDRDHIITRLNGINSVGAVVLRLAWRVRSNVLVDHKLGGAFV